MGTTYTVSGSWACTSMGNPKSVGRLPLTSRHDSPASSLRITSQCFCMKSTFGRDRCMATRCTQWPTSAVGSGMPSDLSPRFIGRHVLPPSSERNTPAAELAARLVGSLAMPISGPALEPIEPPAPEEGAAHAPPVAFAIRRQDERALPCPNQYPYPAHPLLLSEIREDARKKKRFPLVVERAAPKSTVHLCASKTCVGSSRRASGRPASAAPTALPGQPPCPPGG